tara:strand:+ start:24 stop:671 length:648 start_codon:yes stop_codon:yes gene_type:complete
MVNSPPPNEIAKYFQTRDPLMADYMCNSAQRRVVPNEKVTLFQAIAKSIISQQLSVKAATSIFEKLVITFGESGVIAAETIRDTSIQDLRNCGLSRAKVSTLLSTANKIVDKKIPPQEDMELMSDSNIVDALTEVKGIGPWTAEMILIFKLGRPDVMPATDLGIQNGYARIFGLQTKPLPRMIIERSQLWQPYRSTAALYCWQAVDDTAWTLPGA